MAKATKAKRAAKKLPILSAKKLGILEAERKALIAFTAAPKLGRTIAVNGHAHYYDQGLVNAPDMAENNECGTAGCVAGFVYAYGRHVLGKRIRGANNAHDYINQAADPSIRVLFRLYLRTDGTKLSVAQQVVDKMLRTGVTDWSPAYAD